MCHRRAEQRGGPVGGVIRRIHIAGRQDRDEPFVGPAASVDDDIVNADRQSKIHVGFDVLGRHFDTDRNPARCFAHFRGYAAIVLRAVQIRESGRADRIFVFSQSPNFRNFARCLVTGQMAAGPRLGTLPGPGMKGLALIDLVD